MTGGRPPLRGRDTEVAFLRSRIFATRQDGQGRMVVLSGAPGSGKSRLLEEAQTLARDIGARLLHVAGDPDGEVIPHAALLQAVQAGPDPLLGRSSLDAMPRGATQNWWLRQELQVGLEELAVRQPVLVCIDDLQWCGHETLWLLRTLPPQLAGEAVVWVLAIRSGSWSGAAAGATVRALIGAGADRIELAPLDGDAVALLVGDVLGAVPDSDVLASAARAGGSPLLLVELLRGWQDERLVQVDQGRAHLTGAVLPARLREAVDRRTERLSPLARELVQIGAVLGRRFPPDLLASMLDRSPPAVLAPLQEAIGAGLLQDDGEQIGFSHDLIREAVTAGIPAAFARVLRRHAVDVLLARGAPTLQVATMLAESAVPGDLDAVTALREAAATLALTASPAAADFSLRALDLLPPHSPLRADVTVESVVLLWQSGRAVAAKELAATMLTGAPGVDPAAEAEIRWGLARFIQRYSSAEAVRQCQTALALPHLPALQRIRLLLLVAVNHGLGGEVEAGDAILASLSEELPAVPHPAAALALARSQSFLAFHRQEWDLAFQRHHEVVRALTAGDEIDPPPMWEAAMWTSIGHPARSLSIIDPELDAARRDGRLGSVLMWSSLRTRALLDAGRLEESRTEAEAVIDMEEIHDIGGLMDLLVVYSLVRGAVHAGRPDVVRTHLPRVQLMCRDDAGQIRRNGLWLTALVAEAAGDTRAAMVATAEAVTTLDRPGPSLSGFPDLVDEVVLARIALRCGERESAARSVRAAERRAAMNPGYQLAAAVARHARGLLDADERCLTEAVHLMSGTERPLLLASATEDLAHVVAEDRPRDAVAHLDAALAAYASAGAEYDAARVRRRLRELGVRRRRTRVSPEPETGLAALTPAEQDVVRLVAEGGTNRQVAARMYLSPHTVNTHLRSAFVKLGVRSRLELARRVAAEGGLTSRP